MVGSHGSALPASGLAGEGNRARRRATHLALRTSSATAAGWPVGLPWIWPCGTSCALRAGTTRQQARRTSFRGRRRGSSLSWRRPPSRNRPKHPNKRNPHVPVATTISLRTRPPLPHQRSRSEDPCYGQDNGPVEMLRQRPPLHPLRRTHPLPRATTSTSPSSPTHNLPIHPSSALSNPTASTVPAIRTSPSSPPRKPSHPGATRNSAPNSCATVPALSTAAPTSTISSPTPPSTPTSTSIVIPTTSPSFTPPATRL